MNAELITITVGDMTFQARLETQKSPATCAAFLKVLPFSGKLIQARWSGESGWVPLGDYDLGVGPEQPTANPASGELLFYPSGVSETEILFPYGQAHFASKFGELQGNHFLTIVEGQEQLGDLGNRIVWDGAQDITFSR